MESVSAESKASTYEHLCQAFVRDISAIRLHEEMIMAESGSQTLCSVFQQADGEAQATTQLFENASQTTHEAFQVSSGTQVELTYSNQEVQHELPEDQVFEKETDATEETGQEKAAQAEAGQEERGTDSCYFQMCQASEVQAVPQLEEKDIQAVVVLEDKEVHAPFSGESREVQCTTEQTEGTMQTEAGAADQEVQATDFELSINRWALDQVEFNQALQTDSLLRVDSCIKKLT